MPSLSHFTLADMTQATAAIRRLNRGPSTPAERAQRITQYFSNTFTTSDGRREIALARLFLTKPFHELTVAAQARAQSYLGPQAATPDTTCLTLMATTGLETAWNAVQPDSRYLAFPLVSEEFVQQWPMFAQLLYQVGLPITKAASMPEDLLLEPHENRFNVFYVSEAAGSRYVPAQDFVQTYGIRSVLGFGGLLPCGAVFIVILFTTVSVPKQTCTFCKPLTLAVRLALLPGPDEDPDEAWVTIRAQSLDQLLTVQEETILMQAQRLQQSLEQLEEQQAQLRRLTLRLQTAQEEERRRIGHDLHDDIASRLGSAIFELEVRTKLPGLSTEALCAEVQTVRRQLKDIALAVRSLAQTLHPTVLELLGLSAALIQHVEAFRARTGITVSLLLHDFRDPADPDLQRCLFRVVQEGLHNVWKHAPQAHVVISLTQDTQMVSLELCDTGPGFDMDAGRAGVGLGLLNMEERVQMADGTFGLQSSRQDGTRIHVTLPVPQVSVWSPA